MQSRTFDAVTTGVLATTGAVHLLLVVHDLDRATVLERVAASPAAVGLGRAETTDATEGLLRPLGAALLVASAGLVVAWVRRLRARRTDAGAVLRRPAWWTGPGWLLPPLPALAVPEAWRAVPSVRRVGAAPRRAPRDRLARLEAWGRRQLGDAPDAAALWSVGWLLWVVVLVATTVVALLAGADEPLDQARTARAYAARDGATLLLAGLGLLLVLLRPRALPRGPAVR